LDLLGKINPKLVEATGKGEIEEIEEDKYIDYFEDISKPQNKDAN